MRESKISHTDNELVRDCVRGDEQAWSNLIDKYKNLIFSIAIKYQFANEDADEIFQEVCLTLLDAARSTISFAPTLQRRRQLVP